MAATGVVVVASARTLQELQRTWESLDEEEKGWSFIFDPTETSKQGVLFIRRISTEELKAMGEEERRHLWIRHPLAGDSQTRNRHGVPLTQRALRRLALLREMWMKMHDGEECPRCRLPDQLYLDPDEQVERDLLRKELLQGELTVTQTQEAHFERMRELIQSELELTRLQLECAKERRRAIETELLAL